MENVGVVFILGGKWGFWTNFFGLKKLNKLGFPLNFNPLNSRIIIIIIIVIGNCNNSLRVIEL